MRSDKDFEAFPFSISRLSFTIARPVWFRLWQMTNVIWKMENERRSRLKIFPSALINFLIKPQSLLRGVAPGELLRLSDPLLAQFRAQAVVAHDFDQGVRQRP